MSTGATTRKVMLPGNELRPVLDGDEVVRAGLREGKIARMAYFIWQVRGDRGGCAETDWLIAEHVFETGRFGNPTGRIARVPDPAKRHVNGEVPAPHVQKSIAGTVGGHTGRV